VVYEPCAEVAPELADKEGTLVRCLRYTEERSVPDDHAAATG